MLSIEEQISEIIKKRNSYSPKMNTIEERCAVILSSFKKTLDAIGKLSANTEDNEILAEECRKYQELLQDFIIEASGIEQRAVVARKRFSRDTINIGFGGPKGMGKSFLLQKLSGLSDNEVPSGDGLPVTAVRSVIRNSTENIAYITFHTEHSFLEQRIQPFCKEIHVYPPQTLEEFKLLKLPEVLESDRADIYRQKLEEIQKAIPEYTSLLTGDVRTRVQLSELRPYVAYSLLAENGERPKPSYKYLAVAGVEICCEFPVTNVRNLRLIDLPGLGELNPALESIHTEGFKDLVDLCLFIRRPAGPRPDWDNEAQSALDILTENCPTSRPSDFVRIVINAGNCNEDYADIMAEETSAKLASRYGEILRTTSSDSEGLSRDILSNAMNHLAKCLPTADDQLCNDINASLAELTRKASDFCDEAKRVLRKYGQWQDDEEIIRRAAEQAQQRFAFLSRNILEEIEKEAISENDLDDVVETLQTIEEEMDEYFENGMHEKSIEQWKKKALESFAKEDSIGPWQVGAINKLRVRIAQRFSQKLDLVYKDYICKIQEKAVNAFNDREVLNNLLDEDTPEKNLQKLVKYVNSTSLPIPQMAEAVDNLLNIKIEHNAQFYPRAYGPVRNLKSIADNLSITGNTREEKCNNLYDELRDIGSRAIIDIKNSIIREIYDNLFNILLVAYEKFDDDIIRNDGSREEWIRFFKSHFDDIQSTRKGDSKRVLLNNAIAQIDILYKNNLGGVYHDR